MAGPRCFLLELILSDWFQYFVLQEQQSMKITGTIINSRQGLSRNKISNLSEIASWKHFSGSAIILVPTVVYQEIHNDNKHLCAIFSGWSVDISDAKRPTLSKMLKKNLFAATQAF